MTRSLTVAALALAWSLAAVADAAIDLAVAARPEATIQVDGATLKGRYRLLVLNRGREPLELHGVRAVTPDGEVILEADAAALMRSLTDGEVPTEGADLVLAPGSRISITLEPELPLERVPLTLTNELRVRGRSTQGMSVISWVVGPDVEIPAPAPDL